MKGRSIAAAFAGIIGGAVLAYLLLPVVDKMYPPDMDAIKELDGDREAIAAYIKNLPAGFHLLGVVIGVLRMVAGLFIGALIDKTNLMTYIVIGAFSLLLAVLDVFAFPHPVWYGLVYIPVMIGIMIGFIYMKRRA